MTFLFTERARRISSSLMMIICGERREKKRVKKSLTTTNKNKPANKQTNKQHTHTHTHTHKHTHTHTRTHKQTKKKRLLFTSVDSGRWGWSYGKWLPGVSRLTRVWMAGTSCTICQLGVVWTSRSSVLMRCELTVIMETGIAWAKYCHHRDKDSLC